jgi:hypothetical protein
VAGLQAVSLWLYIDTEQPSLGFEYLLDARTGDIGGVFSSKYVGCFSPVA